ncbi:hypothetical protein IV203_030305 [Nitzschia inconspicua]|uniref:Uncharacterized protein n=1 Tax=Nitzschia inconspicua TaxID=303405 RepID=A0A9K3Q436_9STRA|nr:hypothetical protein IV203_030305 [Nitzschia inconspicua]
MNSNINNNNNINNNYESSISNKRAFYHQQLAELSSGAGHLLAPLERGMTLSESTDVPSRFDNHSNHNPSPSTTSTTTTTAVSSIPLPSSPHCLKRTFSIDPGDFSANGGNNSTTRKRNDILSRVQFATPQSFCSCGCLRQFGECSFASLCNRSFESTF